jgi:hypothetical protein
MAVVEADERTDPVADEDEREQPMGARAGVGRAER